MWTTEFRKLDHHTSAEELFLGCKVLELQSSDASGFFNHMLAEPTTGVIVLANAKRKALYAAHIAGEAAS
jgi:hypothetical protein